VTSTPEQQRPTAGPSGLSAVLHDPLLRPLALGQLVSAVGSAMVALAIVYLTYSRSGSIFRTVLVAAAYALPATLLGATAGRLVQRHSRRQLLLVLMTLKMVLYWVLAAMEAFGDVPPTTFLAFSLMSGSLAALTYPAWQGFERDVVPEDELDDVNSVMSATKSAAKLVGAVAGGFLLGLLGAEWLFVANSFTFIPLLVVVWRSHPSETVVRAGGRTRHPMRAALAEVRSNPLLAQGYLSVLLVSLLVAPAAQLLPAIGREISRGAHILGLLTAAFALGGMAVVPVADRLRRHCSRQAVANIGLMAGGVALIMLGVVGTLLEGAARLAPVLLTLAVLGLAVALTTATLTSTVQTEAPPELQGAMYALYGAVFTTVGAGSALVLARIADEVNVYVLEAACGLAVLAISMIRLLRRVPGERASWTIGHHPLHLFAPGPAPLRADPPATSESTHPLPTG
jgi:MFS family permease